MVKPSEMIDYLMLVVLFVTAYTYEHIVEDFIPECPVCPGCPGCPVCPEYQESNQESNLEFMNDEPIMQNNNPNSYNDTPTDYTEFLTAFDNN
jgi:hypothetical protein